MRVSASESSIASVTSADLSALSFADEPSVAVITGSALAAFASCSSKSFISTVTSGGYADYALFVGLKLVAIIEAKKISVDIPSVIDYQCKDYARMIKSEHDQYVINDWNGYKVPFVFATNGRKYLKQIEQKSGIWFLDLRAVQIRLKRCKVGLVLMDL